MIGAVKAALQLSLAFYIITANVVLAAPSGSPIIVEKKLHLFENFESDWCDVSSFRSSPPPYWFVNGVLLKDGDSNTHHDAVIKREIGDQGGHRSQLKILRLTSAMNDSIVTCKVNSVVILEYHLIIAQISALPPTEVKLYVSGQFKSGECVSSVVPYWSVNDTVLNSTVINQHFGADVDIKPSGEGNYLSTVTFSAVKLMLNNSMVSCWMNNMTVLLRYHLIVVEADLVYLDTEEFSANCTNPSITSSHPLLFTYNDIPLVNVTINELYGANVTPLPSDEGHIQVLLEITGRRNSMLNNSMVACLSDSVVIWRFHLIINESEDVPDTTTVAVELSTTTDLYGKAVISSIIITSGVLLLVVLVTFCTIVAYRYKRVNRRALYDHSECSIVRLPDGFNQVPSFPPDPSERNNIDEEEFVVDTEEQEHIGSIKKAMKKTGMLDHTIVHGVFVGPARSGKNCLMERLLGQMPSIVSPSTGMAESTIQVKVIQKATTIAANVEGCLWSRMDYDDEVIHFQKTWSLYLTNTGGQMEFQEVLPLLVSGPIFFFTFRLDRDLDERYDIEYDHPDGAKAKSYTSTLTTMDSILQTLATIAAMGTFVHQGLQKRVFLVGTHKDKLDSATADEHIASIDQKLQEAIRNTSHYANLVEYNTEAQLIFAVNNFSESDSDFKDIRSAVERVIVKDEFQMTSPAHWLSFSLALRKLESAVISYDQCLEIARQYGLADTELDQALKFIHSKMGLIRYFPYYDEVKNLIIVHPQFLFDKVTELIIDTFTFEKTGKHQTDEFRHKGIFSLSNFESIRLREKTNKMISPLQFAKLLERLRIAAPFHLKGEKKYFLPCVLAHSAKEGKISKMLTSTSVPHLMITFECGYCPKGLPGILITYLIAGEAESCYTWKLRHKKIFRNQVSFKVGPHETMTLKIFSTHLEIILIPNRTLSFVCGDRIPLEKVCCEVRRVLEAGIRKVTADINYVDAQYALTFSCECKDCKGSYPGELVIIGNAPYCISCRRSDEERLFPLPKKYELWQIHKISESESGVSPDLKQCCTAASSMPITKLSKNHCSVLFRQLNKYSSKWRDIGLHLGFQPGELKGIQDQPLLLSGAPKSWLSEMLDAWLQWAPGDGRGSISFATLEGLKAALREAELGEMADDLIISN